MNTEIWKPVKGHEGYYEVSNTGKVKSLVNRYKNTKKVFELKQETSTKYGHKRVQLSKPVRARKLVHRLVAEAFIPNPDNKPQVSHLDHDGSNNNIENLVWETQSENLKHAQAYGRLTAAQKKGGVNNGIRQSNEAKDKALSLIGKQFGKYTVVAYAGKKRFDDNPKHLRDFVTCRCECGIEKDLYIGYLKRANSCPECAYRRRRKMKI